MSNLPQWPEPAFGALGHWTRDKADLPAFVLTAPDDLAPYDPLKHLLATGTLSGFADRWGNLALFTTDGGQGYLEITRNAHQCRSALYAMLRVGEALVSLVPGELQRDPIARYGVGYAHYAGQAHCPAGPVDLTQTVLAPPDGARSLHGRFQLTHRGPAPLTATLLVCSDLSLVDAYDRATPAGFRGEPGQALCSGVHDAIGDVWLVGPDSTVGQAVSGVTIALACPLTLAPGESMRLDVRVGFGPAGDRQAARDALADERPIETLADAWTRRVAPAHPGDDLPPWVRDECLWTFGQLLSFANRDASLDEHYVSLGGYGWRGFNQRELGETALILAPWAPTLCAACLRWMARTQSPDGALPKGHNFSQAALQADPFTRGKSSDTEIWMLLGLCAYAEAGGDLDQPAPFRDGSEGTLYDHAKAAAREVIDVTGVGPHGLVRNLDGDWNDYLHPMGRERRGESMMNTGMFAMACDRFAPIARARREEDLAGELEACRDRLRDAAARAFDETHFLRGYTDAGRPVGDAASGRCFLNAQSWAALGKLGSASQRRAALRHALDACHSAKGLALLSKPFPSPPPSDVSALPIPAGEGENAGVWPQATAWAIWALASEGLIDEAWTVWRRSTLRQHAAECPQTPFGIFNGPDCYNSHHAGPRAHWTQVQLWDRRVHTPMNPAVAWQAFALRTIREHAGSPSAS